MLKNKWFVLARVDVRLSRAACVPAACCQSGIAHAQASKHVFELRTYTAPDGKLGDLHCALPRSHDPHLQQARHEERDLSLRRRTRPTPRTR